MREYFFLFLFLTGAAQLRRDVCEHHDGHTEPMLRALTYVDVDARAHIQVKRVTAMMPALAKGAPGATARH